uniref:Uncharacterized protein n=1 Tax=Cucumis melo TaxID=3656 RepID=A0A9I9E4E8_CUCME
MFGLCGLIKLELGEIGPKDGLKFWCLTQSTRFSFSSLSLSLAPVSFFFTHPSAAVTSTPDNNCRRSLIPLVDHFVNIF